MAESGNAITVEELQIRITAEYGDAIRQMLKMVEEVRKTLAVKLEPAAKAAQKSMKALTNDETLLDIEKAVDRACDRIAKKTQSTGKKVAVSVEKMKTALKAMPDVKSYADVFNTMKGRGVSDALAAEMARLWEKQQAGQRINNYRTPAILEQGSTEKLTSFHSILNQLGERLKEIRKNGRAAGEGIEETKKAADKAASSLKKSTRQMSEFGHAIRNTVVFGAVYGTIAAVSESIKVGTDNLYQYSKTVNGSFANSMDRLASSVLYLWNSVGAAIAPLANIFAPVLDSVTDKVVEFVNKINQLIAKLSGASTWTKAVKVQKEYAESTTEAAEAVKNMLAGFDELNVIQNGGIALGSLAKPDYGSMFKEVSIEEIDPGITEFAEKLSKGFQKAKEWLDKVTSSLKTIKGWLDKAGITDFIDQLDIDMEDILILALEIGGAILAWKLGGTLLSGLSGLMSTLKMLRAPIAIVLALESFRMVFDSIEQIFSENGELIDYVKAAVGVALGGVALSVLTGKGIGFGMSLSLLITSGRLLFEGIQMLFDHTDTNDLKAGVTSALSAALGGASLGALLGKGLSFTANMALGFTSVSLLFSGIKGLFDKSSQNDFTSAIEAALGAAMGGVTVAKIASLAGIPQFSLGLGLSFASLGLLFNGTQLQTIANTTKEKLLALILQGVGFAGGMIKLMGGPAGLIMSIPLTLGFNLTMEFIDNGGLSRLKSAINEAKQAMKMDEFTIEEFFDKKMDGLTSFFDKLIKGNRPTGRYGYGSIPAFATGAVITSPTLGLMGEYPNAASNPEIVTPQKLLYETVTSANSEQNALLREQNNLLRQLLRKENSVVLAPSAALGRVNQRSQQMYETLAGGY